MLVNILKFNFSGNQRWQIQIKDKILLFFPSEANFRMTILNYVGVGAEALAYNSG